MKKTYLVICIISFITCLTGIPYLYAGIIERGLAGVNYGRVIFPIVICGVFFWLYKKYK